MFKIDKNKKYLAISMLACAVLAIAIIIIHIGLHFGTIKTILSGFFEIISPIFYGLIIAYICNPVMKRTEKMLTFLEKKKERRVLKRVLSIIFSYIVMLAFISLMLLLTIPQILDNYENLIQQISELAVKVISFINELSGSFNIADIDESIYKFANELIDYIGSMIPVWSGQILIVTAKLAIGILLSFYIMLNKENVKSGVKKYTSAIFPSRVFKFGYEIVKNADRAFGQFFVGQILDSLLVGVIVFIILWLVRMPYYSVVSVLVCITNIIPYFGPFLGSIPSFIIIFISDPIKAFWFLVIILVVQQIDGNIICPRIQSETVGLSSLWIIVAITVIGGLFGVVGMFIAVPLFSTIYTFVQRFVNNRLQKKNLPTEHSAYENFFYFEGDAFDEKKRASSSQKEQGATANAVEEFEIQDCPADEQNSQETEAVEK